MSTVKFTDNSENIASVAIWDQDGESLRRDGNGVPYALLICRNAAGEILGHVSVHLTPLCVIEPGGFFAIPGMVAYPPQLDI